MEEMILGREGVREPVGAMIDDDRSETLRLNHCCSFRESWRYFWWCGLRLCSRRETEFGGQ